MKLNIIFLYILCLFTSLFVKGQTITTPTINRYANVLGLDYCTNTLSVPAGMGAQFSIGDKILIIQMKGATLNDEATANNGQVLDYNNAGNYEVNEILSINSTATDDIILKYEIERAYNASGSVQIVNIPQYTDVTIQNTLTCQAWDGKTGGILIFNASGTVTLNANIDVSEKGFRGGVAEENSGTNCFGGFGYSGYNCGNSSICGAEKGEGIGNRYETQEIARAPNANGGGGGNDHNASGGGGGAFGSGGKGGFFDGGCSGYGGIGGLELEYNDDLNKIFFSGGGGAGDAGNQIVDSIVEGTDGGFAGALVYITSNSISTNGAVIISNGEAVTDIADYDGAGGGGAGGVVILDINTYLSNVLIEVNGGKGGDVFASGACPGTGGGGSGGTVWLSQSSSVSNVVLTAQGGIVGVISGTCTDINDAQPGEDGGFYFDFKKMISTKVFKILQLTAGNDTVICGDNSAPLWAEFSSSKKIDFEWNWSSGSANDLEFNFKPEYGGNYNVVASASYEVFGHFCEETYLVNVDVRNPLINIIASSFFGDTIKIGEAIFLNAVVSPLSNEYVYLWSPSDKVEPNDNRNAIATPYETGLYCLSVTDELDCTVSECINLYVFEPKVIAPNAFSPNGDDLNNEFLPILTDDLSVLSFTVYDRWGAIVYHTKEAKAWNGMKDDLRLSSDLYLWAIEVEQKLSKKTFNIMGNISLIK